MRNNTCAQLKGPPMTTEGKIGLLCGLVAVLVVALAYYQKNPTNAEAKQTKSVAITPTMLKP